MVPGRLARMVLAQRLEQARSVVGEQTGHGGDIRVDGADGYSRSLAATQGRVSWRRRYTGATSARWCGREFAPAVTLTADDEHGHPLDQGMREVGAAGWRTNRTSVPLG